MTSVLVHSLAETALTELSVAWRKAGVEEDIVVEAGQKYSLVDKSNNMLGL